MLEYLEFLVKDRLIPGVDRLLNTRVITCQQRIENFDDLNDRLVAATSAEEVT